MAYIKNNDLEFIVEISAPFQQKQSKKGVPMLVTDGVIIESPDSNKYERDVGIIIYDPDATQQMLADGMLVDTPHTVMASYAVNDSARYNDTLFVKHILRQQVASNNLRPKEADDGFLNDDIPF